MKTFYVTILFFIAACQCSAQFAEGYTDKSSYRALETITFFTKHPPGSPQTSFELLDLGGNPLNPQVFIPNFNPDPQNGLPDCTGNPWENGYDYAPTCTWTVPSTLPSGCYLLNNNLGAPYQFGKIPVIIKGDNTSADIIIVCPTNTINAYTDNLNTACPNSLYDDGITTVSFHRPQLRLRYLNFDDGFLDWIRTWAANHNPVYHLNFISDQDMDDYNEIANAKLLIIPGHSEYWTRDNRQLGELSFSLFPNPTTGTFTLKISAESDNEKSITILDMVGKTIWQSEKNFNTETTIDISQHPRGIYLVKVTEGEKTTMKQIAFQ
jgi:hypothetical protein